MSAVKIVVWKDDEVWVGYLQDYPDYWTQGDSLGQRLAKANRTYGTYRTDGCYRIAAT